MTAPVTVPVAPALASVPGVELMRTGQWDISTGRVTFTRDDLAAAAAAVACPAVRRPVLKLGHESAMPSPGDGEPAVGWVANMALADAGNLLIGDYTGMPGWLGDVLPSAYPDRSIEGEYDYRCQLGHTHPFVVHAVALLGVVRPGIGTLASLQDVAALYGVAAAAVPGGGTQVTITVRASQEAAMPNPRPVEVAAGVTTEDVRRQYYETAGWSLWICEMQLDPTLQLIVENDDDGSYARVPVTISGETVTFADPIPVAIQYVDKPATAAASAAGRAVVYASRAESRPGERPQASDPAPQPPATEPVQTATEGGASVALDLPGLRSRLGLPADADEEAINAALAAPPPETAPAPTPAAAALPAGVVAIEQATVDELRAQAALGVQARTQQLTERRDRVISDAVRAGRIMPSRRAHWEAAWTADAEGAEQALASLAPGLVPVDGLTGVVGNDETTGDDALYAGLFGAEMKG